MPRPLLPVGWKLGAEAPRTSLAAERSEIRPGIEDLRNLLAGQAGCEQVLADAYRPLAAAGVLTRGLVALGAAYAIVTIAGLLTGEGRVFGLVEVDAADHVLHLLLTVLFFGLALASSGERR